MHSKELQFEKLLNVRDLCSIKNKDGFYIKEKKLIRGVKLSDASDNDINRLYEEYNVRMIFDFRTSIEKYELPDPIYKEQRYFDIPSQEESYIGVSMDEQSRRNKEYFDKLDKQMKNENFMINHMKEFYYSLANDYTSKQYAKFLKLLLENENCAYWHCSLGRDRSGIATVLLLECLDVDKDTIYEDYLYTNKCKENIDRAHKEFLDAYYQGIKDKYGNLGSLFTFMGVDESVKNKLKDKYLER